MVKEEFTLLDDKIVEEILYSDLVCAGQLLSEKDANKQIAIATEMLKRHLRSKVNIEDEQPSEITIDSLTGMIVNSFIKLAQEVWENK